MTATAQQPKTDVQNHGVESARGVLRRWPVAVGLVAAAASLASGAAREGVLITLMIACLCYAAAAAGPGCRGRLSPSAPRSSWCPRWPAPRGGQAYSWCRPQ